MNVGGATLAPVFSPIFLHAYPLHLRAPQLPLRRLGCRGRADARQPAALAGGIYHRARGAAGKSGGPG
ncbi:MAG: hypothetical protein WKG07_38670 [Hymenobacter sp.]